MNWRYSIILHTDSYANLQIKPFVWIRMKCVWGIVVFADLETDSSSCKWVEPWRADWSRTALAGAHMDAHARTHAHTPQYTQGPLKWTLVTPHKSIESLQSRRAERTSGRRGLRRSGHGSHFPLYTNAAEAGQKPKNASSFSASDSSLRNNDRYRRRCP